MNSRHLFVNFVLVTGTVLFLLDSCTKISYESQNYDGLDYVVSTLNKVSQGLVDVALAANQEKVVTSFNVEQYPRGISTYNITFDCGCPIKLPSGISSSIECVPQLSIAEEDDILYWTLGDSWLLNPDSEKVNIFDSENSLSFINLNGKICYQFGNGSPIVIDSPVDTKYEFLHALVDVESLNIAFELASGVVFRSTLIGEQALLKKGVPNQAFYKDVFLDAGIGLTSRTFLYSARALDLSLEGVSLPRSGATSEEISLQQEMIGGNSIDENGCLLYPDGQPRFRLLFVNGGSSTSHGKSLGEDALANMREFVRNGGSYVGTCAGAFFAANGYDEHTDYPYYLNLWPGVVNHTGLTDTRTDMSIVPDSPLLKYYKFGGDLSVKDIRHNKGGYPVSLPDGTEVLALYSCPQYADVHQKPSVWSYKVNDYSGRVVMEGSHPEEVKGGERQDLTSAMILYAMDGVGDVSVKGFMKNNSPERARIGDLQVHHYAMYVPHNAKNITLSLSCPSDINFRLMLCKKTYSFPEFADEEVTSRSDVSNMYFDSLDEGIWYVGVQCLDTVETENTSYGQKYIGKTKLLNGVAYSLTAKWVEQ